ncbi:MAG: DUF72 domain-containing protein [Actinomycetes bacterium]
MGVIKVGTASWTDKTLLDSGWYPPEVARSPDARLRYYAERFPVVEVDATYYALPSEETVTSWRDRTPKDFTWNVKAFSLLTQHPTKPRALPKDLRPETAKKNLYLKDVPDDVVAEVWDRFRSAVLPLYHAGKLGALLFQFPPWFVISKASKHYILECKERAEPMQICVEFRNKTWMSADNQAETLDFLTMYGLPYVAVDMPQGFTSSIPPVVAATSPRLSVVRFHGHSELWNSKNIYERFGYLYDDKELEEWAPRLEELANSSEQTHALMNNCYADYAQRNAAQLAQYVSQLNLDESAVRTGPGSRG